MHKGLLGERVEEVEGRLAGGARVGARGGTELGGPDSLGALRGGVVGLGGFDVEADKSAADGAVVLLFRPVIVGAPGEGTGSP